MNTTYHDLFDTQYEADAIVNRLKYSGIKTYKEIFDYIRKEEAEIQMAFWALLYKFHYDRGYEFEEYDEYRAYTNYTLVENFANRFGWTRTEMFQDFFGEW